MGEVQYEALDTVPQEIVGLAVMNAISQGYTEFPFTKSASTVLWQGLASSQSFGLFTQQGAYYLKKYINGAYIGLMPLRLIYKCSPSDNAGRLAAEKVCSQVARWLERNTSSINQLITDNGIQIEQITRSSPTYKSDADNSGFEQYTCSINIRFYKK